MKKFLLVVAVAATTMLADSQLASAKRGGCGGGRHGHSSCGGCGGGNSSGCGTGGCGMSYGGCGTGGCGMSYGGSMGCSTCGSGSYTMGGAMCANGVCSVNGAAMAQATGTQATLIVKLPEDATLTIDGEETTSTSANRVFVSPSLTEGKEYEYTLKAKVVREGKTEVITAKVTVRPGEVTPVELKVPAAGVAAQ
jgi:uncharacterized protein (TIGR03000 family)